MNGHRTENDIDRRLDAFTDAAFAFAVTLLIIGGTSAPSTLDELFGALGDIPAFAFGFAMIVLFWFAHVRWRVIRGAYDSLSIWLTLGLIFLTLIYVQPLRAMAQALGDWMLGHGGDFKGNPASLFAVYGTGFVAMASIVAALFSDALRNHTLSVADRLQCRGERWIWVILAVTGLISIIISRTRFGDYAAMVYMIIPVVVTIFVRFYNWKGAKVADGLPADETL